MSFYQHGILNTIYLLIYRYMYLYHLKKQQRGIVSVLIEPSTRKKSGVPVPVVADFAINFQRVRGFS